ncbi:hypothetical protein LT85_p024 (plasmid) [Collimonas arenae]|uniref:Uncharacterized protein n=1 Tax=Collimonas arenae TaxID=279058 RepID=A0A0A1FHF8_9BURK|nr:hypothetical protein [Collimonas arenae]AIY44203.1 hypothetical protein LT85_p024 [Collimonas arenae]
MTDLTNAAVRIVCSQPSKLTKRDLEVAASLGGKYSVTVHQTEGGYWTVAVKFEGKGDSFAIETARGDTKAWRNILNAISYAQENFKSATDVFVRVGKWNLARTNDNSNQ